MRYRALLLANWEYKTLDRLNGPSNDVQVMLDALTDPDYGLFSVENVEVAPYNLKWAEIGKTIEGFLKKSDKDDYLLIYYSGHGGLRYDKFLALCGVDTDSF